MFGSQEIGSGLVSLEMIFEALQSELLRFIFFAEFKNPKIPGIQPNHNPNHILYRPNGSETNHLQYKLCRWYNKICLKILSKTKKKICFFY